MSYARWHSRILGVCLVVFALELGVVLLILPWYGGWWDVNSLPLRFPTLRPFWFSPYVRGAVSGLGLLNIYVALLEVLHRRRPQGAEASPHAPPISRRE